jgi:hypothetical protein
MFEEVPREPRGVARLLLVRRVVLGPFVLGGGMLAAALCGSVAVAAAATVITASAITSDDDLPARPGHAVTPSASQHESVSARRAPAVGSPARPAAGRPAATAPAAGAVASLGTATGAARPDPSGAPGLPSASRQSSTAAAVPGAATHTSHAPVPAPPAGSPAPEPAPSASGPLGNALIHVSGYDPASGRVAYQFATVNPDSGAGGERYLISGTETFTVPLAPSITITSGGGICLPAGSSCAPDQLIRAADSGFFAEAAIDADGVLRSVVEVGDQPPAAERLPLPDASIQPYGSPEHPGSSSPAPSASPGGGS